MFLHVATSPGTGLLSREVRYGVELMGSAAVRQSIQDMVRRPIRGAGGNPASGGPNGGAGAAIGSGGRPGVTGWVVRSCWSPGNCLLKFCALLPPLEDDPPDPAAPIDEPGDAVDAPAIAEDAGIPGDLVEIEFPDDIGGITGLMPAADLAIPAAESLVAGVP